MTVYTWLFNGSVYDHNGFTSLKECCSDAGVSYSSASRGKRLWVMDKGIVTIIELKVQRIKGRGRKGLNLKDTGHFYQYLDKKNRLE